MTNDATHTDDCDCTDTERRPDGRPDPRDAAAGTTTRCVSLPLTDALVKRIELESDPEESMEDWLLAAINGRLARIDGEYQHTETVTVEIPDGVRRRAQLRYEHALAQGRTVSFDAILGDYVQVHPKFVPEGSAARTTTRREGKNDAGGGTPAPGGENEP